MRILHISPMYYPSLGGAELHLQRLSEGLASRGHEVTVLTANVDTCFDLWPSRTGSLPSHEIMNGVKVVRFRADGGWAGIAVERWLDMRGGYRALRYCFTPEGFELIRQGPKATFSIIPHVLRARADVVMSMNWYWPPAYYTYLARKVRSFRLVGIPLFHTAECWCGRAIYDRMLPQCDAVVTNTEFEAEFARARGASRTEVVGVGIDPKAFLCKDGAAIRAKYGLGNRPVVGFVGRQAPNKGICLILEAIRQVWEWNPEVRLVLAGPKPTASSPVEALLKQFTQAERDRIVRIHDFPDSEKASIYDAFDVLALPSTGESFGLAYLEAWACSKPVIGARIGPTRCVIEEGVDGFLVDPNDAAGLTSKIIELLLDRDKRERMGRSGHDKTFARFTWDQVTDKIEQLYQDVAARGSREDPNTRLRND